MIKRVRRSLAMKISVFLLAMVVLCALLVGVASYILYRADSVAANADRALAIADSAAALLEPGAFAGVMASGEKNAFWHEAKRALDEIKIRTDVKYLYVLGAEYTDTMVYFAEGFDEAVDEDEMDLWDEEDVVIDGEATYADEMYETLRTGEATLTEVYTSGDFGAMVSGFAAVKGGDGRVVGVVGVDILLGEVMAQVNAFALRIVLIIAVFCILAGIFSVWFMNRNFGKPIGILTGASDKMAEGDMEFTLPAGRQDEIGRLSESFRTMAAHTGEQISVLKRLAEGDLTAGITPRSEKDVMNQALSQTLAQLNEMFLDVQLSSHQVANGADQIASGAQTLASGATQQAATLEEFSAAIGGVLGQATENAEKASTAYNETMRAGTLMEEGMASMDRLAASMQQINESAARIAGVIRVVDEIASQTNLLALNAAVEAARAGQHGKGFAVVAEEVRGLAAKSAEAAKETAALIEDSINKVEEGVAIAGKTQKTLQSVGEIALANGQTMEEINSASDEQNRSISEITTGIGELSGVVHANSATAEQSAAAAQEMSSQAQMLNAIVARFRLPEQKQLPGRRHE